MIKNTNKSEITYKDSGVDIDEGNKLITNIAQIIGIPAFLSVILSIAVFIVAGIILFNNLIKKNIPI